MDIKNKIKSFFNINKNTDLENQNVPFFKRPEIQKIIASIICIILGILIGFIILLIINPRYASGAVSSIIKNFMNFSSTRLRVKNFGNTLVKTAPLIMCALSVLFSYKVGLFNIGAPGQYCAGICACLYAALKWHWHWIPCLLFATLMGALVASIVGYLKSYRNVNEVISGIMLNWIILYMTNAILTVVKEPTNPYTLHLREHAPQALLPTLGLGKLFNNNEYIGIAIPIAIIAAIAVMIILDRTKFGYELRATGFNKFAAKYCGMKEKKNMILSLIISGALAGMGAALFYLTGFEEWLCTSTSVPNMGFNGIAATFLGGLNPIGTVFASYFIQHITDGGSHVNLTVFCTQISDLISAVIIYLCAFSLLGRNLIDKFVDKCSSYISSKKGGNN